MRPRAGRRSPVIDQRRLARAVGAQDDEALARPRLQCDVVERAQAAEVVGEPQDLQRAHAASARRRRCTRPSRPSGANSVTATYTTPSTSSQRWV
jgi:hypothetical protein